MLLPRARGQWQFLLVFGKENVVIPMKSDTDSLSQRYSVAETFRSFYTQTHAHSLFIFHVDTIFVGLFSGRCSESRLIEHRIYSIIFTIYLNVYNHVLSTLQLSHLFSIVGVHLTWLVRYIVHVSYAGKKNSTTIVNIFAVIFCWTFFRCTEAWSYIVVCSFFLIFIDNKMCASSACL